MLRPTPLNAALALRDAANELRAAPVDELIVAPSPACDKCKQLINLFNIHKRSIPECKYFFEGLLQAKIFQFPLKKVRTFKIKEKLFYEYLKKFVICVMKKCES